jgi:hypothetical protein
MSHRRPPAGKSYAARMATAALLLDRNNPSSSLASDTGHMAHGNGDGRPPDAYRSQGSALR